ncbi:XAP5-domain-containing protein [Wallemia mellicola]|nr:XAP5-domain-containing protein [Wallemia mellicola]TIB91843.1 XAP5-domain-containing protein [Wallemia mellicola]TIC43141.1 XAP5-domain-containing protein [Wallemia mellicola]TIC51984.1 XAP5-domain-containing protein [Wallemia mellicola]TIC56763.1 XAP5-domain-containing protein [Wallemia mellicola]
MSKEFSIKKTENKESVEESLKKNTIGLVHLDDFKQKRKEIEEEAARNAAGTSSTTHRPKKKSKTKKTSTKLSFAGDDGDLDGDDTKDTSKKLKNPQVDTSFLPDRDRDIADINERERLRKEFLRKQEDIKSEDLTIQFAYFDGTSHKSTTVCKKGENIAQCLDKTRQKFPKLKSNNVDNLMMVMHDLILPHHYTFYDFQVNQTRSKLGHFFDFTDAEKAAKVVERNWYNSNKHIFPASKWEQFDKTTTTSK